MKLSGTFRCAVFRAFWVAAGLAFGSAGAASACSISVSTPDRTPFYPTLVERAASIVLVHVDRVEAIANAKRAEPWTDGLSTRRAYLSVVSVLKGDEPHRLSVEFVGRGQNESSPDVSPGRNPNFWRQPRSDDPIGRSLGCTGVMKRFQEDELYLLLMDDGGELLGNAFGRESVRVGENDPWNDYVAGILQDGVETDLAPRWTVREFLSAFPQADVETLYRCQTSGPTWVSAKDRSPLVSDAEAFEVKGLRFHRAGWRYSPSEEGGFIRQCGFAEGDDRCRLPDRREGDCEAIEQRLVLPARRSWTDADDVTSFQGAERIVVSNGRVDFADLPREFVFEGQTRYELEAIRAMLAEIIAE